MRIPDEQVDKTHNSFSGVCYPCDDDPSSEEE